MGTQYEQTLNLLSREIKKDHKAIRNRLQSILLDNRFLKEQVLTVFPDFPVVPNERCGLWYCEPGIFNQTSYFKSTDGHTNQCDFSVRRLNLHLLPTLATYGGIVVVDSTRRGKKLPDALSKTVPIWCAVLNTLMLEHLGRTDEEVLFCPPGTVSKQEYAQIKAKLPGLVFKLKEVDAISGEELVEVLGGKILRPLWVYPGSSLLTSQRDLFTGELITAKWESPEAEKILPVVLCAVSYQCQDGVDNRHGFTYVQGAADDHELWANGLTAELLWENVTTLGDPALNNQVIQALISAQIEHSKRQTSAGDTLDKLINIDILTPELHLGKIVEPLKLTSSLQDQLRNAYSYVLVLSENAEIATENTDPAAGENTTIEIINLSSGSKKSSKNLRTALITICPSVEAHLQHSLPILICCSDGKDMSVCVLLSVLCRNYNVENWRLEQPENINKTIIKKHLSKMITKLNGRNINPPRASLNSVNAYLM
ncbi:LAME_0G13212g1_1 [Lachancea meyersii CBS 8951]|uniref:LAME_0G13212g1_1 n=1 Tax=Lachancea meyersii CBS 8951 TaxID=1266667 RepID=A0A1G4KA16_9SACH|nr:LAME_0G13212g1_1 [Lachancea meyersii CBS 8951]